MKMFFYVVSEKNRLDVLRVIESFLIDLKELVDQTEMFCFSD